MPGVIGGTVGCRSLSAMADAMDREPWYGTEALTAGDWHVALVHHAERDPAGRTTWDGGDAVGVVHGVVSNRSALGLSTADLFRRVLDAPDAVLPSLNGPFLLVAADRDRVVVATDKLGTRPCYYSTVHGFLFGSELAPLLTQLSRPRLDERAVGDLLTLGHVAGPKTLAGDVVTLRPASYLRYEAGNAETRRYWTPDFGTASPAGYVDETVDRYRRVVSDVAATAAGPAGVWLSGDLDDRTLAAALDEERDDLCTYARNAATAPTDRSGARVADALGLPHRHCDASADAFVAAVGRGVEVTDGMVSWSAFANFPATLRDVSTRANVLFPASGQDVLLGGSPSRAHLSRESPVDALAAATATRLPDEAAELLTGDVAPRATLVDLLQRSDAVRPEHRVTSARWQLLADSCFRTNRLARSQVATRVPFADGAFLDHLARMPDDRYRRASVPFTRGTVPYGVAPLRLRVARRVAADAAGVPCEGTAVAPRFPLSFHAAGAVVDAVRERRTPDTSPMGHLYRSHDGVRRFVDGLLDDACDRDLFDDAAVRDLQQAHLRGDADNLEPLAAITTVELWLQRIFDAVRSPTARRIAVR
ncbi:asparagine synthase-related protein [Halomicrococcus gelatinilyticus]|uniref:asparagine synthase-related protein n=1 Tax=Halomicrococcus gelatinilyticus TaxID=1702103 RepID=UPI002E14B5A2